ncbi:MAG: error-prone DNA polymerase [Deltaproteobacteria bacterium]|nr:error-prone DNA polymerase [Deltaproteobacteria bacterium]
MTSAAQRWVEPWATTAFSLLEGASMPEELVAAAAEQGLDAIGVADRDSVYGLVRAWKAARSTPNLAVLHGATLTVAATAGPPRELALYAMDEAGWGDLCELLTRAHAETPKGEGLLRLGQLLDRQNGLVALAGADWARDGAAHTPELDTLRETFGDRLYLCAARALRPDADAQNTRLLDALSRRLGCVVLASARPLMHSAARKRAQDVLTCVRLGLTIDNAGHHLQPNAERHLKGPAALGQLYADRPDWLQNGGAFAERVNFRLDQLKYHYPREIVPEGQSPMETLRDRVRAGMAWRYPEGVSDGLVHQIQHELALIEELDFPAYFLTVYDIVRFARERGILCQGRGSAANSLVCYALGVTSVDPAQQRLLFERFISRERAEPPDIDVDFEHERREEVIQYIYGRYGRHRAAMVNEIISYRPRSAVRDVGRAMGLSLDQVDRLAKDQDWWDSKGPKPERAASCGVDPNDPRVRLTLEITTEILGFPRHLSIHVGGFVISEEPLRERCPIEPAVMENRTVLQWDKDDIDAVNFVKVDVLALGILTAIRKCFDLCREHHGHDLDLASVPREDPFVYDMLCRADTLGVFQIESRAQQAMLPRLKPRSFYDLVVEVALVRPGPIQGGMVNPYLERRSGKVPIIYAHPKLEPILERTLGVPIFQEQVMEMAMAVGGFAPGEADELRRAMGSARKRGGLERLVRRLVDNMEREGIARVYAEQVAKQIMGFGDYGFPESHAASFALLVYVSSYLRRYFPAAFAASLLNAQPMGFYPPRHILDDLRRHGVEVRPLDINRSCWDNTLEPDGRVSPLAGGKAGRVAEGVALRVGFRQVSGLGEASGRQIEEARRRGAYTGVGDLARRTGLRRDELMLLARADALRPFGLSRRQAAWAISGLYAGPLFAGLGHDDDDAPLPEATAFEELQQDWLSTGLSLDAHPLGLVRPRLDEQGVTRASDLGLYESGDVVEVAGVVVLRQRPSTASGVLFMTLEDETGLVNLVVWPKLYEAERRTIRHEPMLRARGRLQREGEAVSLLAQHFEPVDVGAVPTTSRDFR